MWHAWVITNAYKILVGKFEGKIPHGRSRHRWENSIRIWILREKGVKLWIEFIWLRIGASGALL
jgi:hypothetical protein